MKNDHKQKRVVPGFRCLLVLLLFTLVLFKGSPVQASEDFLGPPTPTIKTCSSLSVDSIQLEVKTPWSLGFNYEIYRSASKNGPYKRIDTVEYYGTYWFGMDDDSMSAKGVKGKIKCIRTPDTHYFIDSSLKFNQRYYYKIRLNDGGSQKSAFSEPQSAKTVLGKVSYLRGYVNSSKQVKLNWQAVDGASGYLVYRKTGKGEFKRIGKVTKKNTTSYTDRSAKSGKTYYYRVRPYRRVKGKSILGSYNDKFYIRMQTPKVKGSYSPGSVYGPSLSSRELSDVKRAVQTFKNNYIRSSMSDYEKVLTAYNFLRSTCSYAFRGWQYNQANTAWGALIYGEAQCSGYARGMKALCDGMGISCYYVNANSQSLNPSHQWNQVKINGKWYILDVQGGYFLLSGKTYQKMTGMRWNTAGLPACKKDYKKKSN